MVRVFVTVLIIAVIAAGFAWFAELPDLKINWLDRRIDILAVAIPIVLALLAATLIILDRLWRWLRRSPGMLGAARGEKRKRQGYMALTQGMAAVAAGDAEQAAKMARKAEALLDEPPLTLLLSAQAAQLGGDARAANTAFSAMLEKPETEFLGLRGLLVQALRQGDTATALKHAKRAYRLRPNTPWVVRSLFALQTGAGLWTDARTTLAHGAKQSLIPADDAARQTGLLLLADAQEKMAAGQGKEARFLAVKAHEAAPSFAPAAELAARLLLEEGKKRKAVKLIKDTWTRAPHPMLAEAFNAAEPGETPEQKLKRFSGLQAVKPDHTETRYAHAQLAMAAGAWDTVRDNLTRIIDGGEADNRVYALMAELEKQQHGDSASAREWLFKAANAPEPQTWSCRACASHAGDWSPRCPSCETFDGLTWGSTARQAKLAPSLESLAQDGDLETLPPPEPAQ